MNNISQSMLIKQFNDNNREQFNEELFHRDSFDIIEELKKAILSCQRDKLFTLKVDSFTVIEDYGQIQTALADYENRVNGNNKKKKVNKYEFVDLKESDVILLIVKYFIRVKEKYEYLDVFILVPRIVDKYYFRISGNVYSAMYQIVDGSTYNNSTSTNAKTQNITLKTLFMPIKLFKKSFTMSSTKLDEVKVTNYTSMIFSKYFYGFKYILAKFGLYKTLKFMGITCISITDKDINNDMFYTFNSGKIFINVPKVILDNDNTTQALVHTIYSCIRADIEYEEIFRDGYWLESLGGEFSNYTEEKGESVLYSLEGICDMETKESIHLPEENKRSIYHILRWMITEFGHLKAKDNLDISTKKIRYPEYIASLYAMSLCQSIYRLSDLNKRITIESVRKYVMKRPTYLLDSITKCRLVNYRNLVNDLDSMTALKYTYKGISGIGEKSNKSVPAIYRSIHVSQLGRVDIDSSPKSDPGMGGIICPLAKMHNGSFSEYQEPNFWDAEFSELMDNYKSLISLKEIVTFKQEILGEDVTEDRMALDESIANARNLIKIIKVVEDTAEIETIKQTLEDGGMIYFEQE